jgi:hypothetical protein
MRNNTGLGIREHFGLDKEPTVASNIKVVTRAIIATLVLSPFLLAAGGEESTAASAAGLTAEPAAADSAAAGPTAAASGSDGQWHLSVSPYLWLPGIHGDVGALGRDVGFKASPADLLSHFRFGLMGAVEARRNRLLLTTDLIYFRLGADNALPFERLGPTNANITFRAVLLTPKIGFRVIDNEKIKVDALTGFRYWHFGEDVSFSPSRSGLDYSASQNWVSPVVGGRIEAPLSPKLAVTILGDVGGWGAGSQLEYQVAGLLGYKIKPKWTLVAGYRYLNLDYHSGGNAGGVINLTLSGIVFGATVDLSKQ